jgi:hypothetical protein
MEKNKENLRIEIQKSFYKPDSFCIRIGDITGSTESSNISKEEVLEIISDEMNELKDLSKENE